MERAGNVGGRKKALLFSYELRALKLPLHNID